MEKVKQTIERLNKYGEQVKVIADLSKKTGQQPGVILGAIMAVAALLVLIFLGGTILTVIITVLYPSFKSIKALETKDNSDDDKAWLTYWTVFGMSTLIDEFCGFILEMIPFYFYIKLGFFVWLMLPQTQGAIIVYKKILRPILDANKDKIEKIIAEVKGSSMKLAQEVGKQAQSYNTAENLSKVNNFVNSSSQDADKKQD